MSGPSTRLDNGAWRGRGRGASKTRTDQARNVARPSLTPLLLAPHLSHTQSFSSVVGPNGSGKSNVIDALLFVFGKRAKQVWN